MAFAKTKRPFILQALCFINQGEGDNMKIGYARVSTQDQNLDLQKDALRAFGCEKIFTDHLSGVTAERPGLTDALAYMRPGDTLVVWKLDRLGRTLKRLIQFVTDLQAQEKNFVSLKENIDTTSSTGKLIFHIFGALAEFERDVIVERTKAGLAAARARGRLGGRKAKLTDAQLAQIKQLYASKTVPIKDICETYNISKPTLYRYLGKKKIKHAP